jgi:Uma2 family endonuclease
MSSAAFAETPVAAYLALEAASQGTPARHEYWDGQLRAKGSASLRHNRVAGARHALLWNRIRGGACEVFAADMRVRLTPRRYVYPDVVVACPPEVDARERPESLTNPKVIMEVLSDSTAVVDRTDKLDGYRALPSLLEYVIVDPAAATVEHYARQPEGGWLVHTLGPRDRLSLESLGVGIELQEVFSSPQEATSP